MSTRAGWTWRRPHHRPDGTPGLPPPAEPSPAATRAPTPRPSPPAPTATVHVDSRTQGLGAFHRLVDLSVEDDVVVVDDDGDRQAWTVTGRRLVDKDDLAPADLFRRDGPARLVLVTCG